MFEQMVSDLRQGSLPDKNLLRKRFDAALVKKMGVIRTPYSFWSADTKINPPAKQLLWAAILLHDKENCKIIEAVIATELEEQHRAKGQVHNIPILSAKARHILDEYIHEFIGLATNKTFRESLRLLAKELYPGLSCVE